MIFEYIKAAKFFPKYAPGVKNYKHKLRGKNGRGNETEFSHSDKELINSGVKKFCEHLLNKPL